MVIVPTPALLIVTSSPLVGTASFDQLFASPQFRVPALPVQVTVDGVITVMETVAVLLIRPVAVSVTVKAKLSLPEKPAVGVYVRLAPLPVSVPLLGPEITW